MENKTEKEILLMIYSKVRVIFWAITVMTGMLVAHIFN